MRLRPQGTGYLLRLPLVSDILNAFQSTKRIELGF